MDAAANTATRSVLGFITGSTTDAAGTAAATGTRREEVTLKPSSPAESDPGIEALTELTLNLRWAWHHGTDDLWAELEMAALLAKQVAGNAAALPAAHALRMATINGARALGLAGEIGSLVAGKAADVICVDLSGVEHHPMLDPVSQLVYAASRHDVTDVWIAGEQLVADRALVRLDTADVCAAAGRWARRLRG